MVSSETGAVGVSGFDNRHSAFDIQRHSPFDIPPALVKFRRMFRLRHLDLTLPTPAENLACDEALLDWREAGGSEGEGILRFWEPQGHFVVLGYANRLDLEVNVAACHAREIPVHRRCTGGGSVLQGPGCLNYTLVLPLAAAVQFQSISETNAFVMQRHRQALAPLAGDSVSVQGFTDLAVQGRKFSGNAQRRKRHWLLFHGTFLLDFDLHLVEQVLLAPPKQPAYRDNRSHLDFLTRLPLPADTIKMALQSAWNAGQPLEQIPHATIRQLCESRYSLQEWNLKW